MTFTKEELETVLDFLDIVADVDCIREYRGYPIKKIIIIRDKIKSIISDYYDINEVKIGDEIWHVMRFKRCKGKITHLSYSEKDSLTTLIIKDCLDGIERQMITDCRNIFKTEAELIKHYEKFK